MGGEHQEVAAEVLHIKRNMRSGLRGINEYAGAGTAGPRADLCRRIDVTGDVGDMAETDEACSLRELSIEVIEPHATLIIHVDIPHEGTPLLGHQAPGQEVRSVLGHGQKHLIARPEARTCPGARHEIDALGGPSHPHYFIGMRCVDEAGQRATRAFIQLIGTPREGVKRRTGIGVVLPVILEQRCEHRRGTLRRSSAVEVGERVAVHGLVKCREVGTPASDFFRPWSAGGCRPRRLPRAHGQQGPERRLPELAPGDFAPAAKRSQPHRRISSRIVCGCQP